MFTSDPTTLSASKADDVEADCSEDPIEDRVVIAATPDSASSAAGSIPEDLQWQVAVLLPQAGERRAVMQAAGVLYSRRGWGEDPAVSRINDGGFASGPGRRSADTGVVEEAQRVLKNA